MVDLRAPYLMSYQDMGDLMASSLSCIEMGVLRAPSLSCIEMGVLRAPSLLLCIEMSVLRTPILLSFQYIIHVYFYKIKKNTSMHIKMHLITIIRVMNPHHRYLQAKVKLRNEPKQVMPKIEDLSRSHV